MRYCNNCRRLTTGEPLFCNFCGSSYDVKLCPSRHMNPRTAEVCSECGSRDFSTPAPRLPFWAPVLLHVLALAPGVLLFLLSLVVLGAVIQVVLTNQQVQAQLVVVVLLIAFLWWLYLQLPAFLKSLLKTIWRGKRKH